MKGAAEVKRSWLARALAARDFNAGEMQAIRSEMIRRHEEDIRRTHYAAPVKIVLPLDKARFLLSRMKAEVWHVRQEAALIAIEEGVDTEEVAGIRAEANLLAEIIDYVAVPLGESTDKEDMAALKGQKNV